MNPSSDSVLRYLAGNENIEEISIDELQKLADESPYFPVFHFLLAKKLKAENHTGFLQQVQKTALYFSNPWWLHYRLLDDSMPAALTEEEISGRENIAEQSDSKASHFASQNLPNEEQADKSLIVSNVPEVNQHLIGLSDKEEIEEKGVLNSYSYTFNLLKDVDTAGQPEEEMAAVARDTNALAEEFLIEALIEDKAPLQAAIEEVIKQPQAPANEEATDVMEEMAGASRQIDETTEAFLSELPVSEENAEQTLKTTIPPFTADNQKVNEGAEATEPDEHERMFQNIKAMLDATSEEAEADVENAVIAIDPYYTIDYFASQGIKLELEQNPKDQLGQHLKKFTQWLKHMKKLGPEDAVEVITRTDSEADIQKIAESSNTVREVVTEAMASVLEKQGKRDKAIELYKKLSFINPDKSAYFAGKIENLKGI